MLTTQGQKESQEPEALFSRMPSGLEEAVRAGAGRGGRSILSLHFQSIAVSSPSSGQSPRCCDWSSAPHGRTRGREGLGKRCTEPPGCCIMEGRPIPETPEVAAIGVDLS